MTAAPWTAPAFSWHKSIRRNHMRDIPHFIDGRAAAGASGQFGEVFDPNTGQVQARVALASAAEVDAATPTG